MAHSASLTQTPDFLKLLAHDLRWGLLVALARSDLRVQELVELLDRPANLVSYHLKRLRALKLVKERRSAADGRDIYYSVDVGRVRELYLAAGDNLHPALNEPLPNVPSHETAVHHKPVRVLFLCTENSARSQMAEGLLRDLGGENVEVYSAGSAPTSVNPLAVRVLAEIGIDIHEQRAKHMDEFKGQRFDYVITVCDRVRESCPVFPGDPERIHWSFADPADVTGGESVRYRAFKQTLQELNTRVRYLAIMIERERGKGR